MRRALPLPVTRARAGARALALGLALALAVSCRPDLGERDSLITHLRILAVISDPPEAKPGETVTHSLLIVSTAGRVLSPPATWGYCAAPRRLVENGSAAAACLAGEALRPIGEGTDTVSAVIPADACALFGPELTSRELRPRDPDITGGYYQPLRVTAFDPARREPPFAAMAQQRITCNPANVTAEVAADLSRRHLPNRNPTVGPITSAGSTSLANVRPGATLTLRVAWDEPAVEIYAVYDPATRRLVDRREGMRASWFTTAGSFRDDRTGREADEPELFTENDWTAPDEARTTHVFVVVRDARGGVAFSSAEIVTR